jgi:hypothetical protein
MSEDFMKLPVCVLPWLYLGIGWNKFGTCCNASSFDFGNVKENISDINKDVFNHENYLLIRGKLLETTGGLPEPCKVCSLKGGGGALHQSGVQVLDILTQIEDSTQRYRAVQN